MAIDVSKAWIGRTTHQNQRPRRIRHRGPTFAPSLRRWAASLPVRSPASLAASAQRVAPDPAIAEAVDQRPGLLNVPWPLPPRAFSQSRVEAPSPELIVPLPLHAAAYVSDVGLTTAVPPRSYLPASVGATLQGAEGSARLQSAAERRCCPVGDRGRGLCPHDDRRSRNRASTSRSSDRAAAAARLARRPPRRA